MVLSDIKNLKYLLKERKRMAEFSKSLKTTFRVIVAAVIMTGTFVLPPMPAAHAADGDLDNTMTGFGWANGIRIAGTSNRVDGAYDVMAKADGTWTVSGYWSNNNSSNTAHSWFLRQYDSVGGGTSTFQGDLKGIT